MSESKSDVAKIRDSGEVRHYAGGAQRDSDSKKPWLRLICPYALWRLGHLFRSGAVKRGLRNWEKGIKQSDVIDGIERHVQRYKAGDGREDHLSAIAFWSIVALSQEERFRLGVAPYLKDYLDVEMSKTIQGAEADQIIDPPAPEKKLVGFKCNRCDMLFKANDINDKPTNVRYCNNRKIEWEPVYAPA